jgi:hypothetical protein
MRKLTVSAAFAFMLIAGGTGSASAAPWCAWYDAYTYNCGFYTFEQCRATVSGAGGFCYRNVRDSGYREPQRRPRDRY